MHFRWRGRHRLSQGTPKSLPEIRRRRKEKDTRNLCVGTSIDLLTGSAKGGETLWNDYRRSIESTENDTRLRAYSLAHSIVRCNSAICSSASAITDCQLAQVSSDTRGMSVESNLILLRWFALAFRAFFIAQPTAAKECIPRKAGRSFLNECPGACQSGRDTIGSSGKYPSGVHTRGRSGR